MNNSTRVPINHSLTSKYTNKYTKYLQKLHQSINSLKEQNDDSDNTNVKKNFTPISSISQTQEEILQNQQDKNIPINKAYSRNPCVSCKNIIRFDIKGIPIKKGKPHYHHISYIDNIQPFNTSLVSVHEIESFKQNNLENNFEKLSKGQISTNRNPTCCCSIY